MWQLLYHQAPWYCSAQLPGLRSLSWSLVEKARLLWSVRELPAQKEGWAFTHTAREGPGCWAPARAARLCAPSPAKSKGGADVAPGNPYSADVAASAPPCLVCACQLADTLPLRGEATWPRQPRLLRRHRTGPTVVPMAGKNDTTTVSSLWGQAGGGHVVPTCG